MHSIVPSKTSLSILGLEAILLTIAVIQLIRFCKLPNIHLKKVIHVLIAFQLIASIAQVLDLSKVLGIDYKPFVLFSVQEAAFVFGALAYFTVVLFWIDFNSKLRSRGPGIAFLQTHILSLVIFALAFCYIGAVVLLQSHYVANIEQGWKLSFKLIWGHLAFYCFLTPLQLYYSYRIHSALGQFYFTHSNSFNKTKKILHAVNFCFVMRTASIITYVTLYHTHHPDKEEKYLETWPAFICFYVLDQILPAFLFMFLLRKSPKHHQKYDSQTYSSLESNHLAQGSCKP